jgi:plastocyanin
MNRQTVIIAAVILLVFIGAVWFIATKTYKQQPQTQPAVEMQPNKTFEVTGKPFEFGPKELRVKKGDVVQITFKNNEGFHDLTIEGYDVKTKQIPAGQSDTVKFTADKAGTFTYYCGVGTHRQQGMEGKLIVEE